MKKILLIFAGPMKISYNWLKTLLPIQETPEAIEALLTGSGLEVEHYEQVDSVRGGLRGLLIGEVVECGKHPNADKLSLTKVSTGSADLLSIVCGAPNVAAGQKVIVAPVGCTIYPVNGEPFTLQKAKIRGEISEGMLCAEDEIGLGESHAGILILPSDAPVGQPLSEYFKTESDVVFEIGLTANRGDAASHTGVARELATLLNIPFELPDAFPEQASANETLEISVEDPNACPRYSGLIIRDIEVKDSPDWLKNRLSAIGLRPINNVVDITNFVLHHLGQPLHAFDLDKIRGARIEVRQAGADKNFRTLDGIERTLQGSELMICDAEGPLCMAGIYGGFESGVSENTTAVFLESAHFAADSIRKTAKQHGLSTDSSFRFERGSDPEMCHRALRMAAALLCEYAGGKICSEILEVYPRRLQPFPVILRKAAIRKITGIDIPGQRIESILQGLGIQIISRTEEVWHLEVPRYKSDVQREIDVIEELIRIHGFEHIPLQTHLTMSLSYKGGNRLRMAEKRISEILAANGFREIMNNSLSSDRYYPEKEGLVYMNNPLSAETNVLRGNMLFEALESIAYNKNRKQNNTRFFEFGKTYSHQGQGFSEKEHLLIIASGNRTDESWEEKPAPADHYYIRSAAQKVLDAFGAGQTPISSHEVDNSTLQQFGIKDKVYYTLIDWTEICKQEKVFTLKPIPQFPVVRRDLSLVLDSAVRFEEVQSIIQKKGGDKIVACNVFDVYEGKPLEAGQKAVSISLELCDPDKTMSDSDIDPVVNRLIRHFETELNAVIRK